MRDRLPVPSGFLTMVKMFYIFSPFKQKWITKCTGFVEVSKENRWATFTQLSSAGSVIEGYLNWQSKRLPWSLLALSRCARNVSQTEERYLLIKASTNQLLLAQAVFSPMYIGCTFRDKSSGFSFRLDTTVFSFLLRKMMGETNAVRVKIQLIEIMKTGQGKIIHFKDMKKVSLFCLIQRKSIVSQSVYQCSLIFGEFSLNLLWDPPYLH